MNFNKKFEKKEMGTIIDKSFLIETRRNAYIECTENYLTTNTVVGIFGDDIPLELFYACGTLPVPMEGIDAHIFKFDKEGVWQDTCDVIKSTLIYLSSQRCPILYSCKMYVLQNNCQKLIDGIKANTEKPVLVYSDEASLIDVVCKVCGTSYNDALEKDAKADLEYIKAVLKKAKYFSNLTCEEFFLLEFYSKYITNLKMRKTYFENLEKKLIFSGSYKECEIEEVTSLCPRGNYEKICKDLRMSSKTSCTSKNTDKVNLRIKRVWENATYGYSNCPFTCKKEMNY